MTERKQDWDVITGWEKRIKVDFGSIGPNHVRWSHWTYKERDIVARKVHESAGISRDHGPRSRRMEDWAKEHAPIMIDFARDHKPMPDWAHADYRESGVPEHVKIVWKRERPHDPASAADWAYDPPGPWEAGEEPAWSAPVGLPESGMDPKYGGVVSYKTMPNGDHVDQNGNVISTAESRAKEDVPDWRKFELGRLEDVDGVIIPGPNALPQDEERYGGNVKFTNIHKTRGTNKASPKADQKIVETVRGYWQSNLNKPNKGENWRRVLIAFGVEEDDGAGPFTVAEALKGEQQWSGWKPVRMELERLEGTKTTPDHDPIESGPKPQYRIQGTMDYGDEVPKPGSTGWYTREAKWLPKWYWELPEITDDEAKEQGATSRASVAPLHYIYHKKGTGILGRQKPAPERFDLPIWTKAEAAAYYQQKGIKMRSRQWLDGHLMQHPGYTDNGQGTGTFVARAASEEYEASRKTIAVPNDMAAAIKAGDWEAVAKLAQGLLYANGRLGTEGEAGAS